MGNPPAQQLLQACVFFKGEKTHLYNNFRFVTSKTRNMPYYGVANSNISEYELGRMRNETAVGQFGVQLGQLTVRSKRHYKKTSICVADVDQDMNSATS